MRDLDQLGYVCFNPNFPDLFVDLRMPADHSSDFTRASPKLDSLYKILLQEREGGYQDETVVGGLDLFLQRWSAELEPVLGKFSSYSVLTTQDRDSWAGTSLRKIGRFLSHGDVKEDPSGEVRRRATKRRKGTTSINLGDDVSALNRITKGNLRNLGRLGVKTIADLIYLFPRRHNDFANTRKVSELQFGEEQTVVVTVWEASESRQGPKRRSTQAVLGDDTGNVRAIWFNQPYLVQTFKPGTQIVISGKVNVFRGSFVFESPEYELLKGQEQLLHTGRLVPVYPSVDGLPQRTIRRLVKQALDIGLSQIAEFIPEDVSNPLGLMELRRSISQAHYPDSDIDLDAARRRLGFDELFLMQIVVLMRKRAWQEGEVGVSLPVVAL